MKKIKIKHFVKDKEIKNINKENLRFRKNCILCIILQEGKGSKWIWLPDNLERFSVNGNTYFKVDVGTYIKNKIRFMIFLEGISLPIHHGYIEKEEIVKTIKDRDTGEEKSYRLWKIKGLNFDSKVIDILLNRHLADEFTKQHVDIPNLILILLLVINVIIGVIGIGIQFYLKGG